MKRFLLAALMGVSLVASSPAEEVSSFQGTADRIVESAQNSEKGWQRLATLCTLKLTAFCVFACLGRNCACVRVL